MPLSQVVEEPAVAFSVHVEPRPTICCTVHCQVSQGNPGKSCCPCCVFVRLTSPGRRIRVRLLLHGVQERQS